MVLQETVEVQTLQLAEVPVPGQAVDPLDVSLFSSLVLRHVMYWIQNYFTEMKLLAFRTMKAFWHGGKQ